ncbi:MAG: hypothetical protein JWM71_763, partial [Solirubrobacteraceae bacterium]|nr:hypothetical protein [Solirubrobacteraceae bacterium]
MARTRLPDLALLTVAAVLAAASAHAISARDVGRDTSASDRAIFARRVE